MRGKKNLPCFVKELRTPQNILMFQLLVLLQFTSVGLLVVSVVQIISD